MDFPVFLFILFLFFVSVILAIILLGEGSLKKGDPPVLDLDRASHCPYFHLGA